MDKLKIDKRYCQSCGLPLPEYTDLFNGTNKNKTHNEEYCFYCFKDRKYTVSFTLEQVIDEWVKYTDLFNLYRRPPHGAAAVFRFCISKTKIL